MLCASMMLNVGSVQRNVSIIVFEMRNQAL